MKTMFSISNGIIFLLLLSSLAMKSSASNWGPELVADNKNHFICWNDTGVAPDELNSYLSYWNGTVYPLTGVAPIPWICENLVDVFYDDNITGGDALGARFCEVPSEDLKICIQALVSLNLKRIAEVAADTGIPESVWREHVWCHETGHSFGLQHIELGGCMTNADTPYLQYSTHSLLHLLNDLQ